MTRKMRRILLGGAAGVLLAGATTIVVSYEQHQQLQSKVQLLIKGNGEFVDPFSIDGSTVRIAANKQLFIGPVGSVAATLVLFNEPGNIAYTAEAPSGTTALLPVIVPSVQGQYQVTVRRGVKVSTFTLDVLPGVAITTTTLTSATATTTVAGKENVLRGVTLLDPASTRRTFTFAPGEVVMMGPQSHVNDFTYYSSNNKVVEALYYREGTKEVPSLRTLGAGTARVTLHGDGRTFVLTVKVS